MKNATIFFSISAEIKHTYFKNFIKNLTLNFVDSHLHQYGM